MGSPSNIIKFLLENEDDDEIDWKDVIPDPPDQDPYDQWIAAYRPIKNHFDLDAAFDGMMFETYGAELDYVRSANPENVWTLVSGDSNQNVITAGFHFVNRIGNFITKVPWKDGTESFTVGEGDPTTAETAADMFINNELGQDWKNEWAAMPPETKRLKVQEFAESYDLESVLQDIVAVIDKLAANA